MVKWILYGAYGATGRMIAAEAVKRGHRPLLAGRDRSKLSAMASELGLDMLAAEADGSEALAEAVAESDLLLNAAGPLIYHYGHDRPAQRFVAWALLLMYLETILIFIELNIAQITAYGLLTMIIGPVIQWLTLLAVRLLHFLWAKCS